MRTIFLDYLFNHRFFVGESESHSEFAPEIRLSLAKLFNIHITSGAELLQETHIRQASEILCINVPEPFYREFPKSVLSLTEDQLLIDQLIHYYRTYDQGHFEDAGHSLFEPDIERTAFNEDAEIRDFTVLSEKEAVQKLREYTDALLSGTRQLSDEQFTLVLAFLKEYHEFPTHCASKNTAIRLLRITCDPEFSRFLALSNVIKLAEELSLHAAPSKSTKEANQSEKKDEEKRQLYSFLTPENIERLQSVYGYHLTIDQESLLSIPAVTKRPKEHKKYRFNLSNQDRKLITTVLDRIISGGQLDIRNCYENKAVWSGLLHHIHYKSRDPKGIEFLNAMRGSENHSALSEFEKTLNENGPAAAANTLVRTKGSGMLLRNLDYLLSRCGSDEEVREVIGKIDTRNNILLIQLMMHYLSEPASKRSFRFISDGKLRVHIETESETQKRKTILAARDRKAAVTAIRGMLERNLKDRLGKVYIDPAMKNIALPMQEGASQGGFGSLNKGSRIHLPEGKKIRAFTYWEKVNDIDLSVIGLDQDLNQHEFSWRTMASQQSDALTFSGDQTAGYNGSSEYFDIDPKKFSEAYPGIRYLIFCDNIFSGCNSFLKCIYRAGYMLRDIDDSGAVFEPKTVQSSFTIDCDSRFAFLFGLDLTTNDFVWLNLARDSHAAVAGATSMAFLAQYFEITKVFNVYDFFRMMTREVTNDPKEAEIAVTDDAIEVGESTEIIRSYDSERMIALLNMM